MYFFVWLPLWVSLVNFRICLEVPFFILLAILAGVISTWADSRGWSQQNSYGVLGRTFKSHKGANLLVVTLLIGLVWRAVEFWGKNYVDSLLTGFRCWRLYNRSSIICSWLRFAISCIQYRKRSKWRAIAIAIRATKALSSHEASHEIGNEDCLILFALKRLMFFLMNDVLSRLLSKTMVLICFDYTCYLFILFLFE